MIGKNTTIYKQKLFNPRKDTEMTVSKFGNAYGATIWTYITYSKIYTLNIKLTIEYSFKQLPYIYIYICVCVCVYMCVYIFIYLCIYLLHENVMIMKTNGIIFIYQRWKKELFI